VVSDLSTEMAAARLSISQCGYNTALDVVRAGVPALVVPFAERGETEQMDRARRLAALGVLRVLPADRLNDIALARAIEESMAFRPAACSLDLDGANRTARLLEAAVAGGMPAAGSKVRASIASEPRERSAPAKRRARKRVGESEGRKPLG
jgi:predicted glycosyltransferase